MALIKMNWQRWQMAGGQFSIPLTGEVVITLPNFNTAVSQDYMIDNYDQPEMCSITPETTYTFMPDGSAWTLSKYSNFGKDQAKAYSDYIHTLQKLMIY